MRRAAARLAGTSATRTDGTHGNDGTDATPGHDEFTLFLDTRAGELVHEIVHGFGVGDPGLGLPGRRRPARTIDLMSTPVAADGGVSPLSEESVIEVLQRIDDGNRDPEGDHRPGDPGDPEHPASTHSGPDRRLAPGLRGRPAPSDSGSRFVEELSDPDRMPRRVPGGDYDPQRVPQVSRPGSGHAPFDRPFAALQPARLDAAVEVTRQAAEQVLGGLTADQLEMLNTAFGPERVRLAWQAGVRAWRLALTDARDITLATVAVRAQEVLDEEGRRHLRWDAIASPQVRMQPRHLTAAARGLLTSPSRRRRRRAGSQGVRPGRGRTRPRHHRCPTIQH